MTELKEEIIARTLQGASRQQVAAELGCSVNTVYWAVSSARSDGMKLPHGNNKPLRSDCVTLSLDMGTVVALRPDADERGMQVHSLAKAILQAVARDDLVDAVLDDGGRHD